MAQPVEMGEYRHPCVFLHPFDQALSPARHDHVDHSGGGQHRADGGAVLGGDELHGLGGHSACDQAFDHRGHDSAVRMDGLATAAQQRRITRAHAQGRGIGGDVGAAFVDDPDGADGHAHARKLEPVGPSGAVDHFPHGIGQARYRFYSCSDAFQPPLVECEPVEHRCRETALAARLQILGIRGNDAGPKFAQPPCGELKGCSPRLAGHSRKRALRAARPLRHIRDHALRFALLDCRVFVHIAAHVEGNRREVKRFPRIAANRVPPLIKRAANERALRTIPRFWRFFHGAARFIPIHVRLALSVNARIRRCRTSLLAPSGIEKTNGSGQLCQNRKPRVRGANAFVNFSRIGNSSCARRDKSASSRFRRVCR